MRCAEIFAPACGSQLWDYLESRVCLRPLGFDPIVNLLSVPDAVAAFTGALHARATGVFNIPGFDTLPLSRAIVEAGRADSPVPGPMLAPLYGLRRWIAGFEFRYARGLGINALVGADFDLMQMKLAQARAQVRLDRELYALSAEALRFSPVFSSDSIWYYFAYAPRDEARLRADFFPTGPLRYYVQGLASLYHTNLNDTLGLASQVDAEGAPSSTNVGGSIGTSLRRGNLLC